MNRVVVLRAAAGLAAYLRDHGRRRPGDSVVIGYDARHNSDVFARDTAEVMTGAGLKAFVLPRPLPTPLLAFAIRDLGCVAGVMVTASHNPPQDNGYKVYLGDGSQIVPPADEEIAAQIAAVGPGRATSRAAATAARCSATRSSTATSTTVVALAGGGPRDLTIVYTPLHGVGGSTVATALKQAGFAEPHVATAQAEPDPDFPTVVLPQPRGARGDGPRDGARRRGRRRHRGGQRPRRRPVRGRRARARTAGRCCAATRSGRCSPSTCSSCGARASTPPRSSPPRCWARWRVAEKQLYAETLTGFKWIGRVREPRVRLRGGARLLRRPGPREGQGRRLRADAGLRHRGPGEGRRTHAARPARRPRPHLRAARHRPALGADGRPRRDPGRGRPAARPARRPRSAASRSSRSTTSRWAPSDVPPTIGLRFRLADDGRVVVRPSGTEPKIKCYLEVVVPVEDEEDGVDAARISAVGRLDAIRGDLQAAAGL